MAEHGGILARLARSHARDERGRQDLERELAYQVWLSVPRFQAGAKPSTWIYRVGLNTALTWRRNAARHERRTEGEDAAAHLPAGGPDPAARAERGDLLEHLFTALRDLPDADRSLLLLQLDGLAYRDIADVLGITENHVGVALTRARQRLAAQMKGILHELD
jgi:RNA polymerase sigma-70 factor, ECF subfamily